MPTGFLLPDSTVHAFFDLHPHAALLIDANGDVVEANAAAAGLACEGIFPTFAQLTGLVWPNAPQQQLGWSRRLRIRAGAGTFHQVEASLFQANQAADDAALFFLTLRDVTASVQAAQGMQEIESRSKVTSDTAPVLIWMAGADMLRDWFNKSWLKFRGRTLGDELGRGWTEGVHPEDVERCLGIYTQSFEEREPYTMDYRLRRHDGAYRWVLDTGIPRCGDDGAFLGYIGTCLDITDRKHLEDQLAEHARTLRLSDRRREEFLAKLSHELRNPLGPIANAAAILRSMEGGNRNLVMLREIIERQVNQMRRLITDLVDVTRVTKGQVVLHREIIDVMTLIDSATDEVRPEIERRHQTLRVARSASGLTCDGDAQRLLQTVVALIGNAAKFSADGSTILVSVRQLLDFVTITVCDSGRGIAPEFLPQIFDLFVQGEQSMARDESGLGVGLTIAKRIAELHGGSLEVSSAGLGQGTTATLRVPLRASASQVAADSCDLAAVQGQRVLIIDDNRDARESLRLLVHLNGNEVMTAADAAEGLRLAESFSPELVVCDIGLPDVDGFELVQLLRDTLVGGNTRFVALTGYGRAEDRDRAFDSGFDSFLVKPMLPGHLGGS